MNTWIKPGGTIDVNRAVTIDITEGGGGWVATSKQLPWLRVTAGDTMTLRKRAKAALAERGIVWLES